MISVIIPTLNSERQLPRCFDSLIVGAVRGVVREVIVADGGSTDQTLAIADAAGARIEEAPKVHSTCLVAGAALARSEWLLFLQPQTALEPGWEVEVESFIARARPEKPRAAIFRFALDDFGGAARRAEAFMAVRNWLLALPSGNQGLLIPKRLYSRLGGYRALARLEDIDLVRRIGRRRLVWLRARAVNLPQSRENGLRSFWLYLMYALHIPGRILARL